MLIVNFEFGEKMKKILLSLVALATISSAEIIRSNDAEIVLDTDTNLVWQDNSEAKTVKKNWKEAVEYCENLNLAGFDDWKLPDSDELESVVDKSKYPTIKKGFQNIYTGIFLDKYWSISSHFSYPYNAWGLDFNSGSGNWGFKSSSNLVRCVRDAKNLDTLNFSSFLNSLKANTITDKGITLVSTPQVSKSKLFLVKKDGRNYFGTQSELLKEFGLTKGYSQNPFQDIQKLTQKQLNEYFALPNIEIPKITKDEFETKKEFEYRLQIAQEDYRKKVEARNQELEKRKANINNKTKEFMLENLPNILGNPKLENPIFDAETKEMHFDVVMSNSDFKIHAMVKIDDINYAKSFKNNFNSVDIKMFFEFLNNEIILKNISVIDTELLKRSEIHNLVIYDAKLKDTSYKPEKLTIALQEVPNLQNPNLIVPTILYSESSQAKGIKYDDDLTPMVKNLKPSSINNKKWLFAIAIEKYDEADSVTFAKNSAEAFIKTAQKRFGISDRNTYALIDDKATSASIKDRLQLMLSNVKEGDSVYFYYSGHGIPNPSDGEAYILPKDKIVDFVTKEKEFMVRNLYNQLSESKASKVIAFVDSCFSGNTDGISNIKGVAATRMKTKQVEFDKSKMVVITAGTANQFSNAFSQKGHRLFTYYLTKSIAQRPVLDLDSIYKEVSLNVKDESYKMGDLKRQTPQIEGNVGLGL